MSVRWIPVVLIAGFAAAGCEAGDVGDDDVIDADTTLTTVPDTVLIEERTTRDTVRDPNLDRDTTRRDTVRDTVR